MCLPFRSQILIIRSVVVVVGIVEGKVKSSVQNVVVPINREFRVKDGATLRIYFLLLQFLYFRLLTLKSADGMDVRRKSVQAL